MLSVVIPAFNEEETIEACIKEVIFTLKKAKIDHELIIVNDGSTDRTVEKCIEIKKIYNFKLISLFSNMGHMAAITAGLEAASGNFIATMDADLQDPPQDLVGMYNIIKKNIKEHESSRIDVVQAFRMNRENDSKFKRTTADFYYRLIEKIIDLKIIHHAADFRIMRKEVVNCLLALPERNRIYRLLIPKLGFRIVPYPIIREKRFAGKSKYPLNKMIKLAIDSIFAFTNKPLRMLAYFGFLASGFFFLASIFTFIISWFIQTVPGWLSMVLLLLSANAFLFAGLGLLGEYIGRIYELIQARPIANWYEIEPKISKKKFKNKKIKI